MAFLRSSSSTLHSQLCSIAWPSEAFASANGPNFYGLPLNEGTVTLERTEVKVPDEIDGMVPFLAGQTLRWKIAD